MRVEAYLFGLKVYWYDKGFGLYLEKKISILELTTYLISYLALVLIVTNTISLISAYL